VTVSFPLGVHNILLTVTDSCGSFSQTNVSVNVVDTTAPTLLSAPAPLTLLAGANCLATVPNVLSNTHASDNCTPGNQLILDPNPAAGTMLGVGQYLIAVTATDASGNTTGTNVLLTVVDKTAPTVLSVPGVVTVLVGANCQAAVPNVLSSIVASDNCTPANQL